MWLTMPERTATEDVTSVKADSAVCHLQLAASAILHATPHRALADKLVVAHGHIGQDHGMGAWTENSTIDVTAVLREHRSFPGSSTSFVLAGAVLIPRHNLTDAEQKSRRTSPADVSAAA